MEQLREPLDVSITDYVDLIKATTTNESFEIVTAIPAFFIDRLAKVVSFFDKEHETIKTYPIKKMNVYARELDTLRQKLIKNQDTIDFGKVRQRLVPVTVGLDVDVFELTKLLSESNQAIRDNMAKVLVETNKVIVKLVNDEGYRLSSRPVSVNTAHKDLNDLLEGNLSKVITPTQTSDTMKVSVLAPTIPHLINATNTALDYSVDNTISTYESISSEIETIKNYTEALYDTFKHDGKAIKRARIMEVARYIETSANFITQTFNTIYMSNQSVIILSNIIKVVLK